MWNNFLHYLMIIWSNHHILICWWIRAWDGRTGEPDGTDRTAAGQQDRKNIPVTALRAFTAGRAVTFFPELNNPARPRPRHPGPNRRIRKSESWSWTWIETLPGDEPANLPWSATARAGSSWVSLAGCNAMMRSIRRSTGSTWDSDRLGECCSPWGVTV